LQSTLILKHANINIIWASLARSLSGFSSCKLSIAFNPNGVAAESNLKVSSKIQRHIRNRRVVLGILGNTLQTLDLKQSNFPEAPEIINNSISPQKKG
jgi:hypothetical protein